MAADIGIAYPIPSTFSSTNFTELIPITSPLEFSSAPPLLPGLIAASVWIKFKSTPSILTSRFNALI